MKIEDLTPIDRTPLPSELREILSQEGITHLFPTQVAALQKGLLEGRNIVVATPSASGKTLVAKIGILNTVLQKGKRAIYLTPLKALAGEKYRDFVLRYAHLRKPDGRRLRIGISVGDPHVTTGNPLRNDILIATYEKLDSLLRRRSSHLQEIGLVVFDEAHILGDLDRGATAEFLLCQFLHRFPHVQVLLLSATVGNAAELAEWLNAELVVSNWRPVPLREGVLWKNSILFSDGSREHFEKRTGSALADAVIHYVLRGEPVLVFADTRRRAVQTANTLADTFDFRTFTKQKNREALLTKVVERLRRSENYSELTERLIRVIKRGVAFHHAGLGPEERALVEDAFRMEALAALVSTTTLAAGVNLPAHTVVITTTYRYESGSFRRIPVSEIKQMLGRAGRPLYDNEGHGLLLARTVEDVEFFWDLLGQEPEPVYSQLDHSLRFPFHVLAAAVTGIARSYDEMLCFFEKSLLAKQRRRYLPRILKKALRELIEEGFLKGSLEQFAPTQFGRLTAELYLYPCTASLFRATLERKEELKTTLSYLLILVASPQASVAPYSIPRKTLERIAVTRRDEIPEVLYEYLQDPYHVLRALLVALVLEAWIDEQKPSDIHQNWRVEPGDLHRFVDSTVWIAASWARLANALGFEKEAQILDTLSVRIRKGVRNELVPLACIEQIGRARARKLYNSGIRTVEDLVSTDIERLRSIMTDALGRKPPRRIVEEIVRAAKRLLRKGPPSTPVTPPRKTRRPRTLLDYSPEEG